MLAPQRSDCQCYRDECKSDSPGLPSADRRSQVPLAEVSVCYGDWDNGDVDAVESLCGGVKMIADESGAVVVVTGGGRHFRRDKTLGSSYLHLSWQH